MIKASHSDAEILASLAARGIESAKAATMLDDLRHGRVPSSQLPYGPEIATRRSRPKAKPAPPPPPMPEHRPHRRHHKRGRIQWWFVLIALIFLFALGYALFEAGSSASREAGTQDKHELPPAPGK